MVERFLLAERLEGGKAQGTVANYEAWLRPFFAWLSDRDVLTLTGEDLQDFLAGLYRTYDNSHSRACHVRGLKAFFGWLVRRRLREDNPTAAIRVPRTPEQVERIFALPEIEALRRSCGGGFEGLRDRALLEMAFDTGLRNGELRHLRMGDVDFQERLLRVVGKPRPGTPPPVRMVPFGLAVSRTLRRYLRAREALGVATDVLFVLRTGQPFTRRTLDAVMGRLKHRAGITRPGVSWHALRHAFVTELQRAGCDVEALRRMAGWKDLTMLRRYSHLTTADLRRAHDRCSPADRLLRE